MNILEMLFAGITAIATVVVAIATYQLAASARTLQEALEASASLSQWGTSLSEAGGNCATMLSQFTAAEFKEYANRATSKLKDTQRVFLERCAVAYGGERFNPAGDLLLTEKERSYVSNQVVKNLNAFEALALKWQALGASAQKTICAQAGLSASSPYRTFHTVAQGTEWWNYPALEQFMDKCKP